MKAKKIHLRDYDGHTRKRFCNLLQIRNLNIPH